MHRYRGTRQEPDAPIHIDGFEHEHRALLARVARFVALAEDPVEVLEALHFLGMYVDEHMRSEEALMRSAGYSECEAHVREHACFRATFARLVRSYARYGDDPRVTEDVQHDVFDWLQTHVRSSDQRLAEFLAAPTSGGTPNST